MKVPKKLWWASGLAALVIAAHIGTTPERSDDLRVAVMGDCPVAKGALESGAAAAAEIAAAIGDAAVGAAVKTALQIAQAQGQPHVSAPRVGSTAEHFYLLHGRGELLVNKPLWNCLVVTVKDLRAPARTPADGARDPYLQDRVFLEARFVHASDGSAFELQPVTLRYRGPAEPSLLGSAARDLRFEVSFSAPGAKEPFARTALDFAALVPATDGEWGVDRLAGVLAKRSGWLPAPPVGKPLALQAEALKASPAKEPRRTSAQVPTSVQVSLVETRDGSVLWKFVGGLLESFATPDKAAAPPAGAASGP